MSLGKYSKKKKQILLMKYAGETFEHRRHRDAKLKENDNNKEYKKKLEKIIIKEHNKEIKKYV